MSVLSAVEGLKVVRRRSPSWFVPLAMIILFGLFFVQRLGTGRVGTAFGPVMALWFVTIAVLGANEIVREPRILWALNPWMACSFFLDNGKIGFLALGAIVLAVTGAEALYADMGHFGKRPIRYRVVLAGPSRVDRQLSGTGGAALRNPGAVANPFLFLAPRWLLLRSSCWRLRRGHRVAGADFRRVLAHAAGRAARYSPRVTIRTRRAAWPGRSTSRKSTS